MAKAPDNRKGIERVCRSFVDPAIIPDRSDKEKLKEINCTNEPVPAVLVLSQRDVWCHYRPYVLILVIGIPVTEEIASRLVIGLH